MRLVSFLESILHSCSAEQVTDIFLIATACIFSIAIILSFVKKCEKFTDYVPILLISIGILGTFIGISIGLVNFDTKNIDGSISELLEGMKTAFFTTLAGMSSSIIFKIIQSLLQTVNDTPENTDDPLKLLAQQSTSITALVNAIGGESDTSILSQLKLLRSDIRDSSNNFIQHIDTQATAQSAAFQEFSNKLFEELQKFATILSKSATETMIDALRQVIVDFNKHLTEQFGENFRELNNAVRELVVWQENYKEQIRQMTEQYKLGVTAISSTESAVKNISDNTQSIPDTMVKLNNIMEVNQHQLVELENHLAAFKDMRDKAVEAVPVIREQINTTVNTIADSVTSATNHYKELLKGSDEYIRKHNEASEHVLNNLVNGARDISKTLQDANKNLLQETSDLQISVISTIEDMQNRLKATMDTIFSQHKQNMHTVFANIDAGLKGQVENTKKMVESQLGMIDQSMQQELNRVMNEMGKALGRISHQFADDYTRLVGEMKSIVYAHRK